MKLLSQKEAKVISNKYEYNNFSEFDDHSCQMYNKGFKITNRKSLNGNKYMATYVKYCPLGYDE